MLLAELPAGLRDVAHDLERVGQRWQLPQALLEHRGLGPSPGE
ncbi:MAG TPA: hypothetical protein VF060_13675 [Trebonia sp.]